MNIENIILDFYKQTSQFTDLGYYKEFAKNFQKIKVIWESELKYRILCGALND